MSMNKPDIEQIQRAVATSAGFLVIARLGDPWNCGRNRAAVVADERRPLAYLDSHRVFRDRRRCLDNVCARAQARAVGTMELDAGERHHRPDLGHYHFRRPARHRSLGYRAASWHQYGVRRLGADRDGTARPRDRSALRCPGALREAALTGKNLIKEAFGAGARVPRGFRRQCKGPMT